MYTVRYGSFLLLYLVYASRGKTTNGGSNQTQYGRSVGLYHEDKNGNGDLQDTVLHHYFFLVLCRVFTHGENICQRSRDVGGWEFGTPDIGGTGTDRCIYFGTPGISEGDHFDERSAELSVPYRSNRGVDYTTREWFASRIWVGDGWLWVRVV